MNKKRVMAIFLLVLMFTMAGASMVFADDILDFTNDTHSTDQLESTVTAVNQTGNSLYKLITAFGRIVGFLVLLAFGIQWFMSRNDSQGRTALKDKAVAYVVGAIIFFGAPGIYTIVYNLSQAFSSTK